MYSIGLDYGTTSCRGVLYNAITGLVEHQVQFEYPHGVIKGKKNQQFLQNPQDYIDAFLFIIHRIINESMVNITDIKAVGIDFTSCTCLPVQKDFNHFLQQDDNKTQNFDAYAKLWKSHSAEKEAVHITAVLKDTEIMNYYGGAVSSEWLLPKLLELKNDNYELFNHMEYFMEAGDWLVSLLTNNLSRSSCHAGFKGLYQSEEASISKELLREIDEDFEDIYSTKLRGKIDKVGTTAGFLSEEFLKLTGLSKNTQIATSIIDAHAALPGARITSTNVLQIVMGTSSCHLLLSENQVFIPGIAGVVKDGILPGFYAYEAGQAAVGDLFNHFIEHKLPHEILEAANNKKQNIFDYLNEQAEEIDAHGLIILDWHNGSRTPFMNPNLSGVVFGERLTTTAIDYYKALIESTAFGTRQIVERFEENGIDINEIVFAGGIPLKNKLLMQIYADVLQRNLTVINQQELPAVGAARLAILPIYNENPTEELTTINYAPKSNHYEKSYQLYKELSETLAKNELLNEIHNLKSVEV